MILATAEFGITARRELGKTGVWVDTPGGEEKLAAIGVRVSRWVTSHGLAYNVATDLRYFDLIVPCGIADKRATSLEKLLSRPVGLDELKPRLAAHLGEVFGLEMRSASLSELENLLRAHELEPAHAAAS
jgi:lipoyl(octanoyl) transferase